MNSSFKFTAACLFAGLSFIKLNALAQQQFSLAGKWSIQIDSLDEGIRQKWYNHIAEKTILLPGTLDDAGLGKASVLTPNQLNPEVLNKLTRRHSYIGPVWYCREINIPPGWAGKSIQLFLERVIWSTRLWIDGQEAGSAESLSTPQVFEITKWLKPGKHLLAIRIDNRLQYNISHKNMAHAYTDGTQIIWNGIIGKIQLIAHQQLYIASIKTFPHVKKYDVTVQADIQNNFDHPLKAVLNVAVISKNKKTVSTQKVAVNIPPGKFLKSLTLPLGKNAALWDEFNPNLYAVKVNIANGALNDRAYTAFGLREITNSGGLIQVNGRRIFLRGTLECDIFPLTGHPPMDPEGWLKVFNTAKAYGLNHLRFHSWCPPQAAFKVADSLGFYLQVELPLWSMNAGKDEKVNHFLEDEATRIINAYGNHPSFCLWSMGNELQGDFNWLAGLVKTLRSKDPRHLYTSTTFTFQAGHGKWPEPVDDFYITQYTKKGWIRGQGIFNTYSPNFATDYSAAIDSLKVPVITHEMGQYSVFPNMQEIKKYTGVLDPVNFKAIKNDLEKKGLLDLAPHYTLASGKFSALLYKEEIERVLKTRRMSGFQLLDLHDFPGQGTALVGMLDAFWDSKGLVSAAEHRMYCSAVVPLLRFNKATYTSTEQFKATAEVANFSNKTLLHMLPVWTVSDPQGRVIFTGKLNRNNIPVGNGKNLGGFSVNLKSFTKATKLTIQLKLEGSSYKNSWNLWVYPEKLAVVSSEIKITSSLTDAMAYLTRGEKVLLNPDTAYIKGVQGRFAPVFWSPVHFPNQPGTMGVLCDPHHPALKDFPTDFYSNWQWWDLITSSKTMVIDSLPGIKPIVTVIDNFYKNRKMANVIEANVGKGKLILVSMDITHNMDKRPAARQLRYSLERYMGTAGFAPAVTLSQQQLSTIIFK